MQKFRECFKCCFRHEMLGSFGVSFSNFDGCRPSREVHPRRAYGGAVLRIGNFLTLVTVGPVRWDSHWARRNDLDRLELLFAPIWVPGRGGLKRFMVKPGVDPLLWVLVVLRSHVDTTAGVV